MRVWTYVNVCSTLHCGVLECTCTCVKCGRMRVVTNCFTNSSIVAHAMVLCANFTHVSAPRYFRYYCGVVGRLSLASRRQGHHTTHSLSLMVAVTASSYVALVYHPCPPVATFYLERAMACCSYNDAVMHKMGSVSSARYHELAVVKVYAFRSLSLIELLIALTQISPAAPHPLLCHIQPSTHFSPEKPLKRRLSCR